MRPPWRNSRASSSRLAAQEDVTNEHTRGASTLRHQECRQTSNTIGGQSGILEAESHKIHEVAAGCKKRMCRTRLLLALWVSLTWEGCIWTSWLTCLSLARISWPGSIRPPLTSRKLTCLCTQDYFSSTVAPVKKVILNYGPNGMSRGSATVSFAKPTAAAESVKLDGTKVDGRAMRVCVSFAHVYSNYC